MAVVVSTILYCGSRVRDQQMLIKRLGRLLLLSEFKQILEILKEKIISEFGQELGC